MDTHRQTRKILVRTIYEAIGEAYRGSSPSERTTPGSGWDGGRGREAHLQFPPTDAYGGSRRPQGLSNVKNFHVGAFPKSLTHLD